MTKLNKYLKERTVQIVLVAIAVKILLIMFFSPSFSINLDQLSTFVLFGIIIVTVAYLMRKNVTLIGLFLIGFLSIIIYNQGIAILSLIGAVPIFQDILVGIEMGIIVGFVGYVRGVRK